MLDGKKDGEILQRMTRGDCKEGGEPVALATASLQADALRPVGSLLNFRHRQSAGPGPSSLAKD